MPVHSAGLVPIRIGDRGLEVFIAHPGGPFWAKRDAGAWSVVKGEFDPSSEAALVAAEREFAEEVGAPAPTGERVLLGDFKQPSGKIITAFAVASADAVCFVASNTFELEWPRGSGRLVEFPEIDRADWFPIEVARRKLSKGQLPILDALPDLSA